MAKVKITHEFDYFTDSESINDLINCNEYKSILFEIDQELRNKLKHGEDEWLKGDGGDYLEKLRDIIWESGVLRYG